LFPFPFFSGIWRSIGSPTCVHFARPKFLQHDTWAFQNIAHFGYLQGLLVLNLKNSPECAESSRIVEAKSTEFSRVDHSPAELNSVDLAFTKHHRSGRPKIVPNTFRIRRFRPSLRTISTKTLESDRGHSEMPKSALEVKPWFVSLVAQDC
jgi:hypothetical protein